MVHRKILITGADGFIGSHLDEARATVKRGFWAYLALTTMRKWQERYMSPRREVWRNEAKRLPGAQAAWRWLQGILPGNEFSLRALLKPASPYHADFMQIHHMITQSPNDAA